MPWTRGAIGKTRRAGGQAKLLSGCFELSIKWKCCPTEEQSFHHSFAGYGSAAKALETLWISLFNFTFTGCQCNFVNRIMDHGYQAVAICSDTLILLHLQKEQPEQQIICSLSVRNEGKKNTHGSVINITSIWSSLLPMRLSKLNCPSCPPKSQAMGLPRQVLHPKNTFSKNIYFFSRHVVYCYVARYLQPYIELSNTSGRPNQNWEQKFFTQSISHPNTSLKNSILEKAHSKSFHLHSPKPAVLIPYSSSTLQTKPRPLDYLSRLCCSAGISLGVPFTGLLTKNTFPHWGHSMKSSFTENKSHWWDLRLKKHHIWVVVNKETLSRYWFPQHQDAL